MEQHRNGVGVIVPTHNDARTVVQCLQSVASQTLQPDHIIVTDDASSDKTVEIVRRFQQAQPGLNLELISHRRNVGLGKNVAEAVKLLDTRYFTKLDADDLYLNDKKLENERRLIDGRESQVVTYSLTAEINAAGEVVSLPQQVSEQFSGREILYRKKTHLPREFLVSMDAMDAVGGYPTKPRLYVDWWLKVALASILTFESTGEIGSGYRKGPRADSTRMSSRASLAHAYWISFVFAGNRRRFKHSFNADDLLFFPRVWGRAGAKMALEALKLAER